MKYLVVVDMQKDFTDGVLGSADAVKIIPRVKELCESFDGEVIFTRDTHTENYLETQEGRRLPVRHCIKDTDGWQLSDTLQEISKDAHIIDKPTFGSIALAEYIKSKNDAESVLLCGVCTDICVISNAMLLKAFLPEVTVAVKEDACAGITPESHNTAISAMKSCQIDIV